VQEVSVSELRNHLPEYLARAERGEEILVTRRGRVVARLSAAQDHRAAAKRQLEALRARARVGDVVSPVGEVWEAEG
jgi:prevent-host-death family protein